MNDQMIAPRPADFRKCALMAACVAAISVVALQIAGSTLTGSYTGLEGTLSAPDAPTASSPR